MKYTEKQKGSLYLTVVLLGIILAIAVGIIGGVVTGSNLVKGLGDSVRAFHIADSGIDEALYQLRVNSVSTDINCSDDFLLYGTSICMVDITEGEITSIKAIGSYNGSQRRIESTY